MPAITLPRNGIQTGWDFGESGWHTGMEANLQFIDLFGLHPAVNSATLGIPPAAPALGESYLVPASGAIGVWAANPNRMAVWWNNQWIFGTILRPGWAVWVQDAQQFVVFNGLRWVSLQTVITDNQLVIVDRTLTAPPASPVPDNYYIVNGPATGDWTGRENQIATWNGTTWIFFMPPHGKVVYLEDEDKMSVFRSSGWSNGWAV